MHASVDQTFEKINFTETPFEKGEYETCTFKACDLSNADLSETVFIDCIFDNCNLSLAQLNKTSFRDVVFRHCKMMGLHLEQCNTFGLSFRFEHCVLDHSSFYQTKIKKTTFSNTRLQEVDFTECDLTGSVLDLCDCTRALFENTILEKVDMRTALNYSIDPEHNRIKQARFGLSGLPGLLDKYPIQIDRAC